MRQWRNAATIICAVCVTIAAVFTGWRLRLTPVPDGLTNEPDLARESAFPMNADQILRLPEFRVRPYELLDSPERKSRFLKLLKRYPSSCKSGQTVFDSIANGSCLPSVYAGRALLWPARLDWPLEQSDEYMRRRFAQPRRMRCSESDPPIVGVAVAPTKLCVWFDIYRLPILQEWISRAAREVLHQHAGEIRIYYKSFPRGGGRAADAAAALFGAGEQGRFFELHDELLRRAEGRMNYVADLEDSASSVGIDLPRWRKAATVARERVSRDVNEAHVLGVREHENTPPLLVVNDRIYYGTFEAEDLLEWILEDLGLPPPRNEDYRRSDERSAQ